MTKNDLQTMDEMYKNARSLGEAIKERIKDKSFTSSEKKELISELEEMIAMLENTKRLVRD